MNGFNADTFAQSSTIGCQRFSLNERARFSLGMTQIVGAGLLTMRHAAPIITSVVLLVWLPQHSARSVTRGSAKHSSGSRMYGVRSVEYGPGVSVCRRVRTISSSAHCHTARVSTGANTSRRLRFRAPHNIIL